MVVSFSEESNGVVGPLYNERGDQVGYAGVELSSFLRWNGRESCLFVSGIAKVALI